MSEPGYRLILPPGWVKIPLREDPDAAIERILESTFGELPRDEVWQVRRDLRHKLLEQIAVARDNEGVDLYLPVERVHGVTIPASFVVAVLPFDAQESPSPEEVLALWIAEAADAARVDVDGSLAARAERVVAGAAGAEDGTQFPSRHIDYLIRFPVPADVWLTISFSTVGDGDPTSEFTTMMVALFDAMVGTFRWT